ncbi:MAG: AAA-like domain-containing protein, partial [Eubacterium sp.]|nr:AAA-like domain-containing protein [Eubacterium sp.]
MKKFNTTALCIPSKHYMVDLTERVAEIRKLIDAGEYFTINRSRQYGKTTTLNAVKDGIKDTYNVVSIDFQGISGSGFESEQNFVKAFCRLLKKNPDIYGQIPDDIKDQIDEIIIRKDEKANLDEMLIMLNSWCCESDKPIVLMIDEVDSATNNQVFLDFLAQL